MSHVDQAILTIVQTNLVELTEADVWPEYLTMNHHTQTIVIMILITLFNQLAPQNI